MYVSYWRRWRELKTEKPVENCATSRNNQFSGIYYLENFTYLSNVYRPRTTNPKRENAIYHFVTQLKKTMRVEVERFYSLEN